MVVTFIKKYFVFYIISIEGYTFYHNPSLDSNSGL